MEVDKKHIHLLDDNKFEFVIPSIVDWLQT